MEGKISISDLKFLINSVLDKIEADLISTEIVFDKHYYWDIDSEKIYNIDVVEKFRGIGNLSDDADFVRVAINTGNFEPQSLLHVAPILRYISDHITP
jgi:hypothetical protein